MKEDQPQWLADWNRLKTQCQHGRYRSVLRIIGRYESKYAENAMHFRGLRMEALFGLERYKELLRYIETGIERSEWNRNHYMYLVYASARSRSYKGVETWLGKLLQSGFKDSELLSLVADADRRPGSQLLQSIADGLSGYSLPWKTVLAISSALQRHDLHERAQLWMSEQLTITPSVWTMLEYLRITTDARERFSLPRLLSLLGTVPDEERRFAPLLVTMLEGRTSHGPSDRPIERMFQYLCKLVLGDSSIWHSKDDLAQPTIDQHFVSPDADVMYFAFRLWPEPIDHETLVAVGTALGSAFYIDRGQYPSVTEHRVDG